MRQHRLDESTSPALNRRSRLRFMPPRSLDLDRYGMRAAMREPLLHLTAPGLLRGGAPSSTQAQLLRRGRDLSVRGCRNIRLVRFLVVHNTSSLFPRVRFVVVTARSCLRAWRTCRARCEIFLPHAPRAAPDRD